MAINVLQKEVGETRLISMPFTNKMSSSESIVSVDRVVVEPTADLVVTLDSVNSKNVLLLVSGGTSGVRYEIYVKLTSSAGQILENDGYYDVVGEVVST